jgi:hypothetical protein
MCECNKNDKYEVCKEVDKEMTKVVVEVNKNLVKEVNEGLVVVCRKSLKVHMVTTY